MTSSGPGRQGRTWRALSARLRAELPPVCWWCRKPIDLGLPARHGDSWTLDHIIPLSKGGAPEDPANLRPAHRSCNSRRGNNGGASRVPPKQSRRWS